MTTATATSSDRPRETDPVVIHGEIGDPHIPRQGGQFALVMPKDLAHSLKQCRADTVMLYIDTPGGSHEGSVEMFNAIRSDHREITTIGANVLSAGVLVFAAGDRRLMFPGGSLVFHSPMLVGTPFIGSIPAQFQKMIDATLAHGRQELIQLLCERWPHVSAETFGQWMDEQRDFSAQEAVDAGLADGLFATVETFLGTTYATKLECEQFPNFPYPIAGLGVCACAGEAVTTSCCPGDLVPPTLYADDGVGGLVTLTYDTGNPIPSWVGSGPMLGCVSNTWTLHCNPSNVWYFGVTQSDFLATEGANMTVTCSPFEAVASGTSNCDATGYTLTITA
jgi:ATP-dependent protease ClpP protease subunit